MATRRDNRWKAILGMSSDHAGLRLVFKNLEAEMYRALARIDDPREVVRYLNVVRAASAKWLEDYERENAWK